MEKADKDTTKHKDTTINLEKEIVRLANRIGLAEHHIPRLLDGTYKSILVSTWKRKKLVYLIVRFPQRNSIIKTIKEYNKSTVKDMLELVRLVRLLNLENKVEKWKKFYDTDLSVSHQETIKSDTEEG